VVAVEGAAAVVEGAVVAVGAVALVVAVEGAAAVVEGAVEAVGAVEGAVAGPDHKAQPHRHSSRKTDLVALIASRHQPDCQLVDESAPLHSLTLWPFRILQAIGRELMDRPARISIRHTAAEIETPTVRG